MAVRSVVGGLGVSELSNTFLSKGLMLPIEWLCEVRRNGVHHFFLIDTVFCAVKHFVQSASRHESSPNC